MNISRYSRLLCLLIAAILVTALVGCNSDSDTPTNDPSQQGAHTQAPSSLNPPTFKLYDDGTLHLFSDDPAAVFEVRVDSEVHLVEGKTFRLPRTCAFSIRAIIPGTGACSEWSEYLPYREGEPQGTTDLAAPTGVRIVDGCYLDFDLVAGATEYEVSFNGSTALFCEKGGIELPDEALSIRVRAHDRSNNAVGLWSAPITYPGRHSSEPDNPTPTELFVPNANIEANGTMHIFPDANATHYELRIDSHIVSITEPIYQFDQDCSVSIRACNSRFNLYSDWSPVYEIRISGESPQQPDPDPSQIVELKAPIVSVDEYGVITIENRRENVHYYIEYADGTTQGISSPDDIFPHPSVITPLVPAKICTEGYTAQGWTKGPETALTFTPYDSIIFDAQTNPISNLQPIGDGSYIMTAVSTTGKEYRFRLDGEIQPVEGGWGTISSDARFYSLDALHGIFFLDYAGVDDAPLKEFSYGYSFSGKDSIEHADELDIWQAQYTEYRDGYPMDAYPNYFSLGVASSSSPTFEAEPTPIESFSLHLNGVESVLDHATTHNFFYNVLYLSGMPYCTEFPDHVLQLYFRNGDTLSDVQVDSNGNATFVALLDADGNEITDLENHYVQAGDTVRLALTNDYTVDVPLVRETLTTALNSNESRPNSFSATTGTMNTLVIPIYWRDQTDRANEKSLDLIRRALGNVTDGRGNVTTYAPLDPTELSLSAYYHAASYGKLTINSFITDWYAYDSTFGDVRERDWPEHEIEAIVQWVKDTYPDLDLTQFDSDHDGIFDEIILINTGDLQGYDGYTMESIAAAFRYMQAYGGTEQHTSGTHEDPAFYHYINLNLGFLFADQRIGDADHLQTDTIIHEFGHALGLWDYYDTSYSGISALGGYDMMDGNVGDWNVFSKFTAGWITPTVVREADFGTGDTLTFTLRSSTLYGDTLLIPAAGYAFTGSPYDEYLMIDLFTPEGLHEKDSAAYDLQDAVGVRIYHVDDRMEQRESLVSQKPSYSYGMRYLTNDGSSVWSGAFDIHQLEIISSTGINHFTDRDNPNTPYSAQDLFLAGDTFAAEDFTEFFYQGKMDSGLAFGYTVTVESIEHSDGEYVATIVLAKNAR